MGDLPDYYQYVTPVKVEIPEGREQEVWVAEYDTTPEDLPDGSTGPLLCDVKGRLYVRLDQIDAEDGSLPVIPRPKGGILAKGSVTTTGTYASVAEKTVTDGLTLQLAKIVVSCPEDVLFKLVWSDEIIGAEVYVSGKIPFVDWFPWDYHTMVGDGSKKLEIMAKYPSGGAAATCHAEIVGEEV